MLVPPAPRESRGGPAARRGPRLAPGPRVPAARPRSAAAGYLWSGVVAERRPGPGPRLPEPGGQVDRRALLVVLDPQAVVERRDLVHVPELAAQEGRVQVDRDRGPVRGRRWPPQPEVVGAAVGRGQGEVGAVPVDRPGVAVVAGQDRGLVPLRGRQRLVLAGYHRH